VPRLLARIPSVAAEAVDALATDVPDEVTADIVARVDAILSGRTPLSVVK
jgi:hypothetical protein